MIKRPMKSFVPLLLLLMLNLPVSAHSLNDAEAVIKEKERYAQFVDRVAPPFTLFDTQGNPVSKLDLAGKVVVLNFLYTRCADACPLHMNLIAQLQDRVSEQGLSGQVDFITIATDTESNVDLTVDNMNAYGRNFDLAPSNWRFLYRDASGDPELTRSLAEDYGLKFSSVSEGVQMHGLVTHVVDQEGWLKARFHGLEFKPGNLVSYLEVLVKGPSALNDSTWDEVHTYFENMFK